MELQERLHQALQARLNRLRTSLQAVQEKIDQHLFNSEQVTCAQDYAQGREAEGAAPETIDAELRDRGLPSLQRLGLWTLTRMVGWWWLHNRRRRIQRRISRMDLLVEELARRASRAELRTAHV